MTRHLRQLYLLSLGVLLASTLYVAATIARPSDFSPASLVALLVVLVVVGERQTISFANQNVSGAFVALVLAMCLLGPAPPSRWACWRDLADRLSRVVSVTDWLSNLTTYAVVTQCLADCSAGRSSAMSTARTPRTPYAASPSAWPYWAYSLSRTS